MARTYLKEHRPILYNNLVLSEQLFPYLKEIGETAARRIEQLEADFLKANPAPDKALSQVGTTHYLWDFASAYGEVLFCFTVGCNAQMAYF